MSDFHYPVPPETAPFAKRPAFIQALARFSLERLGWRITGQLPAHSKMIIIGVPHTSGLDYVLAMLTVLALDIKLRYMMKKEAFVWPLSILFRALGGIAIDRSRAQSYVEQISLWIENNDKAWIALTPEGTRQRIAHWKTGFLRIAYKANIPILIIGLNARNKEIVFSDVVYAKSDSKDSMQEEAKDLKARTDKMFTGIKPENQ